MNKQLFKKPLPPNLSQTNHDFTPKQWNEYFDSKKDIKIPNTNDVRIFFFKFILKIFRIYLCNNSKTKYSTLVLIHGGGYTSLSWSLCVVIILNFSNENLEIFKRKI